MSKLQQLKAILDSMPCVLLEVDVDSKYEYDGENLFCTDKDGEYYSYEVYGCQQEWEDCYIFEVYTGCGYRVTIVMPVANLIIS